MSESRRVTKVVTPPEPVVEGAGVHLGRSIGTRRLDHLDPFLLLDHFESAEPADYRAGFPYHPHRGIETVTIVRKGEVRHRDSLGHQGSIGAGDIQWMTSGSGILHEEMPQVRPEGIAGLQLWLNLPAREKMTRPKYRDLQGGQLPEVEAAEGARIRVIAGEAAGGRRARSRAWPSLPSSWTSRCPPGTAFREIGGARPHRRSRISTTATSTSARSESPSAGPPWSSSVTATSWRPRPEPTGAASCSRRPGRSASRSPATGRSS